MIPNSDHPYQSSAKPWIGGYLPSNEPASGSESLSSIGARWLCTLGGSLGLEVLVDLLAALSLTKGRDISRHGALEDVALALVERQGLSVRGGVDGGFASGKGSSGGDSTGWGADARRIDDAGGRVDGLARMVEGSAATLTGKMSTLRLLVRIDAQLLDRLSLRPNMLVDSLPHGAPTRLPLALCTLGLGGVRVRIQGEGAVTIPHRLLRVPLDELLVDAAAADAPGEEEDAHDGTHGDDDAVDDPVAAVLGLAGEDVPHGDGQAGKGGGGGEGGRVLGTAHGVEGGSHPGLLRTERRCERAER